MLEEQYRKYYQEVQPSEELNEETFALMKEAQDHRATMPPKPLRWKAAVIIPAAGTVAAALIAVVVSGFWINRGADVDHLDAAGTLDSVVTDKESTADPGEEPGKNSAPAEKEEEQVGDILYQDGADSDAEPEAPQEDLPTADQPEEENQSSGSAPEEEQNPEEDEVDTPASTDPRDPDIINEGDITTYLSLREFLNALSKKETSGYGDSYYYARELIIVPSALPEQARFRHFHLNSDTGSYSYSYLFPVGDQEYFLDIDVNTDPPTTLRDLNEHKDALAKETVQTGKKGNQLFYLFSDQYTTSDYITVTLTQVNSATALTEEEVATLLSQFQLERCSITNGLLDMKY